MNKHNNGNITVGDENFTHKKMKENKGKLKFLRLGVILFFGLLITSCDTGKLHKVPIENFEGIWELTGRPMFNGIKIKIEKEESGKLTGKVISLNDNKYVNMFVEPNDTWVTEIHRISNFEFKLTERKIASDLFSAYGLETTKDYNVEFIDENTIGLGSANSKSTDSSIKYVRVKNEQLQE